MLHWPRWRNSCARALASSHAIAFAARAALEYHGRPQLGQARPQAPQRSENKEFYDRRRDGRVVEGAPLLRV